MSLFGIYIAGPGIVGEMLMREKPGRPYLFDGDDFTQKMAQGVAEEVQTERPYHHVEVRLYEPGDESRGEHASHPDGVTP